MAFTKADKARAVALYLEEGATVAALAVGASRQSVYVWLTESDTDTKKGEAVRAATAERLARKRAAMVELFHDKALELAAAVDTSDPATARFMLAACQAADKALFLATRSSKGDPIMLTPELLESEIRRLEKQLGRRPKSQAEMELDRELSKALKEMDRKTREADDRAEGADWLTICRAADG